nr:MerR family DNA-binding protein [Aeromonas media]
MGLSLEEIAGALSGLPDGRTPDRHDWERIAGQWQTLLDSRIAALQLMKRKLSACIGCGCLSLEHCALYNPEDSAAGQGSGPRYLLGDLPPATD